MFDEMIFEPAIKMIVEMIALPTSQASLFGFIGIACALVFPIMRFSKLIFEYSYLDWEIS